MNIAQKKKNMGNLETQEIKFHEKKKNKERL